MSQGIKELLTPSNIEHLGPEELASSVPPGVAWAKVTRKAKMTKRVRNKEESQDRRWKLISIDRDAPDSVETKREAGKAMRATKNSTEQAKNRRMVGSCSQVEE